MVYSLVLQEGPAETTGYMIAGYALVLGVMLIYIFTLWLRRRNLYQDREMLENLRQKDQAPSSAPEEQKNDTT